jgi:hypothetical protein
MVQPFYVCEIGFLTSALLKTKERNRTSGTPDMSAAISISVADRDEIMKNSQSHPPH